MFYSCTKKSSDWGGVWAVGLVRHSLAICLTILFLFVMGTVKPPEMRAVEPISVVEAVSTEMIVTLSDDRRDITHRVGAKLVVRLEAIPGTGAGWQVSCISSPQKNAGIMLKP